MMARVSDVMDYVPFLSVPSPSQPARTPRAMWPLLLILFAHPTFNMGTPTHSRLVCSLVYFAPQFLPRGGDSSPKSLLFFQVARRTDIGRLLIQGTFKFGHCGCYNPLRRCLAQCSGHFSLFRPAMPFIHSPLRLLP